MKKFLASVGTAKLLGKKNGELYHIADVKTLTESALRFSVEAEEIRAGEGAKLYGKFFHSSKLEINLVDAMWDLDYVANMIGDDLATTTAAHNGFHHDTIENAGETITLSQHPTVIGNACGLQHAMVWLSPVGCGVDTEANRICVEAAFNDATQTHTNIINIPESLQGHTVCAEYFVEKPQVRAMSVGAHFIPKELVLILTTNLYAGDYRKVIDGKPAGKIIVKIPRFQLDGQFDLSMAMTSAATTTISGVALATEDCCCNGGGVYAEVVEVETYSTAATGLKEIIIDPDTQWAGDIPVFYGLYNDGHISMLTEYDYELDPPVDPIVGLIADVEYTVTVGDKSMIFYAKLPDPALRGKPIVFNGYVHEYAPGANPVTMVMIDGSVDDPTQWTQLDVNGDPNVELIAGTTTVKIIGDPDSDEYHTESERPMVITAGDTTVVIYG